MRAQTQTVGNDNGTRSSSDTVHVVSRTNNDVTDLGIVLDDDLGYSTESDVNSYRAVVGANEIAQRTRACSTLCGGPTRGKNIRAPERRQLDRQQAATSARRGRSSAPASKPIALRVRSGESHADHLPGAVDIAHAVAPSILLSSPGWYFV